MRVFGVALICALLSTPTLAQSNKQKASLVEVDQIVSSAMDQTAQVLGRIVAEQSGVVSAQVSGVIDTIEVRVGQRIRKGDVIARIRSDHLREQRNLARAELAEARASVDKAKAAIDLAQQEMNRLENLKTSVAFPQARYDDMRLEVLRLQSERAVAQTQVQGAQARLTLAELDLDDAMIKAPFDGAVATVEVEAGTYVSDNDSIIRLINEESLEVEADVPSDRLAGLSEGLTVSAILAGGAPVQLSLRAIVPAENQLTRTQAVRFTVTDWMNSPRRAVNQAVQLNLPIGEKRTALTIKKDAIIQRVNQTIAFRVEDGKARETFIRIGGANGDRFELLSGLEEGNIVITRGNERMLDGQSVRYEGM